MYWLVYIDLPTTSARELLRLKALSDGRRWILSTNKKKRHRIRCRQRRPIHLCAAFISLVFFYRSLKTLRWDHKYVDCVQLRTAFLFNLIKGLFTVAKQKFQNRAFTKLRNPWENSAEWPPRGFGDSGSNRKNLWLDESTGMCDKKRENKRNDSWLIKYCGKFSWTGTFSW